MSTLKIGGRLRLQCIHFSYNAFSPPELPWHAPLHQNLLLENHSSHMCTGRV